MKKPSVIRHCILTTFIGLCFFEMAFSQQEDFQTWYSFSLEQPLSRDLETSIEQELRLRENSTRLRSSFTDLSLKYTLLKNLDVSASARFIFKPQQFSQRIYSDLSYRVAFRQWSVEPRLRLQYEFIPAETDETYFRPKLTVENNHSKHWEPFLSGELFYHTWYYRGSQFDEYRISAGVTYHFDRRSSLKGFYLLEQEFNKNDASRNHVLGIGYDWKFL